MSTSIDFINAATVISAYTYVEPVGPKNVQTEVKHVKDAQGNVSVEETARIYNSAGRLQTYNLIGTNLDIQA